jgi:tripartite-type tricarboxylate transporter receptor subunit TctC
MSTRMALGVVFSVALTLQASNDYPTKPVRVIEPFGAGGGPDLTGFIRRTYRMPERPAHLAI